MKKTITALILCVLMLSLAACGGSGSGGKASGKIILIDKDDKEYTYEVSFDESMNLRDILLENKMITEEQYSAMFIEDIDGHIANVAEDGCTWLPLDENKNMITGKSFEQINMKDGQTLYLQYYVVPNFDD